MPISSWSTTALSNTNSDLSSGVDWREGQLPATVNNSARALMAEIRKFYDQVLNGTVSYGACAGTGAAYTMSTTPAPTAYSTGQRFLTFANTASTTTAPTMNVATLGAKTIKDRDGSALAVGDIASGDLLDLGYNGTDLLLNGLAKSTYGTLTVSTTLNYPDGGTYDASGPDLASGSTYAINGTNVLTGSALGSGILSSSLTSLGTITSLSATQARVGSGLTAQGSGTLNVKTAVYINDQKSYPVMANGVFNGQTGATIKANGISCSRVSEGLYALTLSTAAADTNYNIQVTVKAASGDDRMYHCIDPNSSITTSTFRVQTEKSTGAVKDVDELHVIIVY